MKIVTSPMCEEILKLCKIENYIINKHPDTIKNVTIAITLSETKTKCLSIKLKLNTPKQILTSVETVSKYFNKEINSENVFKTYPEMEKLEKNIEYYRKRNRKTNVKVYSLFLKDIIEDLGYNIVDENYEYIIYPDYLKNNIIKEDKKLIEISSHTNVSKNPIIRCINRYNFILNNINN